MTFPNKQTLRKFITFGFFLADVLTIVLEAGRPLDSKYEQE